MNEQDFAELAAGAALHALSHDDRVAFDTARRQHPEWEHHVTANVATAAVLADGVADVAPPAGIRSALLARIAVTPQDPAPAAPEAEPDVPGAPGAPARRPRAWRARSWFALAASLALLVGIGWGAAFVNQQLNRPAPVAALEEIRQAPDARTESAAVAGGGEATAYWSPTVGKAVLVLEDFPPLGEDESYQMWLIRDGAAVSAGLVPADDGSGPALLADTPEPGDVLAVTREPEGGSPTGQPTSDPLVAIETP
ncbi:MULTISPECIES: anti-sigma factor [Microbacterium]|uniref:Regulator of SigK n=1 Tax=Microbacterium wangchenii TaxID=2541726 RepID=A0ABX5SY91_9MICO|nr:MULTISPECIES: anti-sigma factor [Microbacterium]MCK6067270.1 anti-sigma factor [Microbacterium sp. EYE_512]QBR89784.1 anti-sigma factor [Microbacterium wangchenii]TXK16618.1 anti-sigma factor [Microbacterium wangchenii]